MRLSELAIDHLQKKIEQTDRIITMKMADRQRLADLLDYELKPTPFAGFAARLSTRLCISRIEMLDNQIDALIEKTTLLGVQQDKLKDF